MPDLIDKAKLSQQLSISERDDNFVYTIIIRAQTNYRSKPGYDFVQLKDAKLKNNEKHQLPQEVRLCPVQKFNPSKEMHVAGFSVLLKPLNEQVVYNYTVVPINEIKQLLHIVHDFLTALNGRENDRIFEKYSVSYDADTTYGIRGKSSSLGHIEKWQPISSSDKDKKSGAGNQKVHAQEEENDEEYDEGGYDEEEDKEGEESAADDNVEMYMDYDYTM